MADAYVTGLRMLARRELSEAQIRTRLARREFPEHEIDEAVARLRGERAVDDRRTALACARMEALIKRRGRLRVLRQVESLGIARDIARAAVAEVFADVDEDAAIQHAIERRLRGERAVDDRRTALACARMEALIKRRGRLRVLRQVESLGIAREIARAAVAEVFADVDEDAAIQHALERRLRGATVADLRRVQQYLLRQGYDSGKVNAAIRNRARSTDYNRSE